MFKLYKKLKYIKQKLKEWNKEVFGNINQGKKSIEDRMRKLQELCIEEGYTEDRKKEEIQMTQEWEARCQAGRNPVAPKVQNKVAKGRGEEYQVFS
jgi:hypothetical protein